MSECRLSPSSAHRWLVCPGSAPLTKDMAPSGGFYADEGTSAHALAAAILTGQPTEDILADAEAKKYNVEDMQAFVAFYVDLVKSYGGYLEVEQKISLEDYLGKDRRGFVDAAVRVDNDLYVFDLKYGMSPVEAEHNPQLSLYAAVLIDTYLAFDPVQNVHLVIVQPRIHNVSQWDVSLEELRAYTDEIKTKAQIVLSMATLPEKDWLFKPNDTACKYCPANAVCRALMYAAQPLDSESDPAILADVELARAYSKLELLDTWIKAVKHEVYTRLLGGGHIPGLKLVEGRRGARKWRDETAVVDTFEGAGVNPEYIYEKKLISPTQIEKLVKTEIISKELWEKLAALIVQGDTKPTVALEDDKRQEFTAALSEADYPNMELGA